MAHDNKITCFALGFGIGIAVGVILAPRSGEETRQFLRSKAGEGKDYLKKQGDTLCGSAGGAVERGKSAVLRQKDQLTAAVEAGKRAYREAVAEVSPEEAKPSEG